MPKNPLPWEEEEDQTEVREAHPKGSSRGEGYGKEFLAFWHAYPKKVGKRAAWKAWSRLGRDRPGLEDMLSAVGVQKGSAQWVKEGGKFIPNPATWLHQGRWEDEPYAGGTSAW